MVTTGQKRRIYEFDHFRVDAEEGLLWRDGEVVPLTPKALEMLVLLVENNGHVVKKEELMERIWPDTFVEEANLTNNISLLRKVLQGEGGEQHYIKTVPRRGYRFVADVREPADRTEIMQQGSSFAEMKTVAETAPTQVAQTGADSTARTTSSAEYIVSQIKSHKRGIAIALAALIVIAGGLAFWLYRLIGQNKAPSFSQAMKITRLTTTGKSRLAVISADGKYVVHVIEDAGKQSLWMRQTAIESNVQILAPADGRFRGLTFSRDGNYIYYVWGEKGSVVQTVIQTLYQLPVLGGEPRKLITDIASAVTFSPDGKQVSFVRNTPSTAQSALMSANADGSGEKTLATRKQPDEYVGTPAWSPDGKTIAVPVHGWSGGEHVDVVVVPAAGGQEKPVVGTERWILVGQLAWLADGSALLMDAAEQNSYFGSQLYEVSYPGGQVRRVTNDLNNYGGVSLTEDSNALVTVQGDSPTSLWVAPEGKAERARQLSTGTGNYEGLSGWIGRQTAK